MIPHWVQQLDPNVACSAIDSSAHLFDVWPEDTELEGDAATTFAALAGGWIAYGHGDRSIDLALRRVASSLGPAAGDFGLEDRLLDLGVAMEAMYGPLRVGKIERKLKSRASRLLAQGDDGADIAQAVERFYRTRSQVVHARDLPPRDELERALAEARDLARRSLVALLRSGCKPDWSRPQDSVGVAGFAS